MIISKICIVSGGILSFLMVIFHIRFYKLFDWGKEFKSISLKNQRIFYTIHIALLLLFLAFSVLSFTYVNELSQATGLALGITCAYSLFWLWRTIWQIIYFRPPKDSDVQKMPPLHYVMITMFALLFIVYLVPIVLRALIS